MVQGVDVARALEQRRMVRSFDGSDLDPALVASIFETSLWSPTAGNARGISWITLVGPKSVARYFDAATDASWRASSPRYEGLSNASAIGICLMDPSGYVERYGADDKAASGLGGGSDAWPVPYWVGDAGAASLAALLLIEEQGLAGCFLGAFRRIEELRAEFGVPEHLEFYGAVLIGRANHDDHRSTSLDRPGPRRHERVWADRYGSND
jgi:nitroreductase